ncbi:TetR/AcrR family transcriptional regulator [Emticicia sp. TH156]|uniref:TetR/AcrR family transcriptional regulator n=1 Tax=Emticicia sp. TH156 TaxID=2067454 RepID=UPI000C7839BB|nr:TetR/AcrR family transcriptional regulator [Emticicia sp. TH156]PLK43375.1 TetR/AcrR family transcriptional regulator [Emticicia sp. TH156]
MRTRNEHKEQLVKEKAIEMIVKLGFDGFSMQKLAKLAGVSPATLYIYYKDKEDLLVQLGAEETQRLTTMLLKDFSSDMHFEAGMRIQWRNRAEYWLSNPLKATFLEQIRHSHYRDKVYNAVSTDFVEAMSNFLQNANDRQELCPMKKEVFWSIAYAPLYNLIRFHTEGISLAGEPFQFSEALMWQTFDVVMKALKQNKT